MSGATNFVTTRPVSAIIKAIALTPPAWTRLEPQSVTGDPAPGLEARLHDPFWLLGRQWQFGEFQGEDAGTPIAVHVAMTSERLTAWKPGDPAGDAAVLPLGPDEALEPRVERERLPAEGPGLRPRAEAGGLLVAMLAEAGLDARAALLAACPLPVEAAQPAGVADRAWALDPLWRTVARGAPDGEAAAQALEAGAPPWLPGASEAATAAAGEWLTWYRSAVAPPPGPEDCWVPDRLEYRFSVRAGSADGPTFRAPAHLGGSIDWYTFDHDPGAHLALPEEAAAPPTATNATLLATPLRYAGMPSDRLWQFEDGKVAFGRMDVQLTDPARLCFIEFATIFGNDWFCIPLDLPIASFTRFDQVSYTTTFNETVVAPAADDSGRSGHFRMFGVSIAGQSGATLPGLLIPFGGRASLTGRALEEVVLLRDENANMAWAIERQVPGRSGDPRQRGDERPEAAAPQPLLAEAELRYLLETTVPPNWIPFVPVPSGDAGGFFLRKGTMTDADAAQGVLLRARPYDLKEEEVTREGVQVRRTPSLSRTFDGQVIRWVAREVGAGGGEGASRLAFDSALR